MSYLLKVDICIMYGHISGVYLQKLVAIGFAIFVWWQQTDRPAKVILWWYMERWLCLLTVVWRYWSATTVRAHAETTSIESVWDSSYRQRTFLLGWSVSLFDADSSRWSTYCL